MSGDIRKDIASSVLHFKLKKMIREIKNNKTFTRVFGRKSIFIFIPFQIQNKFIQYNDIFHIVTCIHNRVPTTRSTLCSFTSIFAS